MFLAASLAVCGCSVSNGGAVAERGAAEDAAVMGSDLSLQELMAHVMQRNAIQMWNWQAFVSDGTGAHSTVPRTDEEWEDAESDALTVGELARTIQQAPYRVDDPMWSKKAQALQAAAAKVAKAAEVRDEDAFLAAGASVNDACVSCHYRFAPQLEGPEPTASPSEAGQG
ncbi:hypothetical protein NSU_2813 [Novosphingobium pentaromativorans US6-1]|uniref:Cytochrome c domain-containing protein n=2 Tax=Novosphingobium pentaromativorans TaxID=205844 RepID=G6EEP2_9SPHN|nr:hypothetical protein NSU_2813 [Novosphingobium pentaromativorans US6-1]